MQSTEHLQCRTGKQSHVRSYSKSIGCWQAGLLMAGDMRTHRMALTGDMGVPKPPVRLWLFGEAKCSSPEAELAALGAGTVLGSRTRTDQDEAGADWELDWMTLSLSLNLGRTDMFASQKLTM